MINGMDKFIKHLEKYSNISMKQPVSQAISMVQAAAKAECVSSTGELRESIFTAVNGEGSRAEGVCYTNKKYAPYVEFGTGPKGQEAHEGISPEITVAYSQSPWWIHESQIDKELAEKYHWFYIDTKDGRFYQCKGQPARPFMYPALKNNESKVMEIVQKAIKEQMK